jgi:O-acetyl-ADP-ribose deacetylase (regulator of RNase III)
MSLVVVKGNLIDMALEGQFNVIVHGCNCFNTMGSGIAKEVRDRLPHAWQADQETIPGSIEKLGTFTRAVIPSLNEFFVVVNAYTQFNYNKFGEKKDHFNYTAFALILEKFSYLFQGQSVAFPMIGMGRAGGNSILIMNMLNGFAGRMEKDVTIVEFNG